MMMAAPVIWRIQASDWLRGAASVQSRYRVGMFSDGEKEPIDEYTDNITYFTNATATEGHYGSRLYGHTRTFNKHPLVLLLEI